jgi:hypothetical protein
MEEMSSHFGLNMKKFKQILASKKSAPNWSWYLFIDCLNANNLIVENA